MNRSVRLFCLTALSVGLLSTLSLSARAQATFSYSFAGAPGDQVSTAPTTTPPNLILSNFARGGGVIPDRRGESINSINWNDTGDTGTFAEAITQNEYYTFTATPTPGGNVTITQFAFSDRRLGQGPDFFALRYIINGTATTVISDVVTSASKQARVVPITGINNVTTPVEVRLYAYSKNADGTGTIGNASGGWIVEDSFGGTGSFIAPVVIPESSTHVLLGIGSLVGIMGGVVRRLRCK